MYCCANWSFCATVFEQWDDRHQLMLVCDGDVYSFWYRCHVVSFLCMCFIQNKKHAKMDSHLLLCSLLYLRSSWYSRHDCKCPARHSEQSSIRREPKHNSVQRRRTRRHCRFLHQTPTTTRDHPVTTRLKSPSVAGSISCCTILTSRQPTGRHVPPKTCCLEKTWKWIITCLSCLEIIRITVSHGNRPKFCAFFSHTKHQHNPGGKRRVGATVSELDMAWNDCEGRQHAIYYNMSTFQETAFY